MDKKKKKDKWVKRIRNKYRLQVLSEGSFEEKWNMKLTPLNVIASIVLISLVFIAIVFSALAFTPLRNVIPGYANDHWRQEAMASRQRVDSLQEVFSKHDQYLQNLSLVLSGGVRKDTMRTDNLNQEEEMDDFIMIPEDSALRARIAEEERFALNFNPDAQEGQFLMFNPLDGLLSSGFDAAIGHFGVDIVAPKDAVIKAAMDGTVLISSWTSDSGHILQIQHPNNTLTIYKHNSVLLKNVGDVVKAGDPVAVIGNSGDHTDGPHLHFELWQNGVPLDPEQYLTLEK